MVFTIKDLAHLISKRSFCILATQDKQGPHAVGVCYYAKDLELFIPTSENTAKVRNIRRNSNVAIQIPVPWPLIPAPPRSIQYRGIAEILPIDDNEAQRVLSKSSYINRHVLRQLIENIDVQKWGESIWIRVVPTGRIETFMIGVPITVIFRSPEKAQSHFDVIKRSS
ncbi:pyridoxamine 5'-phosphate oxidase family protein [Candidatus Bathyarchaeota archaeon]|nr:pyridoxamine 5'-phosphate oxidase family protein [Candidatus Bathyarchaeota archaeon]